MLRQSDFFNAHSLPSVDSVDASKKEQVVTHSFNLKAKAFDLVGILSTNYCVLVQWLKPEGFRDSTYMILLTVAVPVIALLLFR